MSTGFIQGLRVLHRAFSRYPAGHRLHILIRYFTCPFTRTLEDVPAGARVLEIGSGHAAYGALIEDRVREVIAVEPDLRKSLLPSPSKKIRKVAGFDECVRGNDFDAAVVYDVTYRMPADVRNALFARLFARLRPGGVLVFKDMDNGHRWKMKWARAQEWLSDHLLHISIGEGFIYQSRAEVEAMLTGIGFTRFTARAIDTGYPHPHVIYTAVKPG